MYRSGAALEHRLNLESSAVNGALCALEGSELGPEIQDITNMLREGAVGYTYADQFRQPRLIRPNQDTGGMTFHFVDDRDPMLRWYPDLRHLTNYNSLLNSVSIPHEALASSTILGALLLHEGTHARDFANPEHAARAQEIFPGASKEEALHLVSEVNAFTLEGHFLDQAFGPEFAQYIKHEVAEGVRASEQDEEGGLLIQLGIDTPMIEKALDEQVGFINDRAKEFSLEILHMAVTRYAAFRLVDQLVELHNVPEAEGVQFKVSMLGDEYLHAR